MRLTVSLRILSMCIFSGYEYKLNSDSYEVQRFLPRMIIFLDIYNSRELYDRMQVNEAILLIFPDFQIQVFQAL